MYLWTFIEFPPADHGQAMPGVLVSAVHLGEESHTTMRHLICRLTCALRGHDDTVIVWGLWRDDPEMGRHRIVTESCIRCGSIVNLASVPESDWYAAVTRSGR